MPFIDNCKLQVDTESFLVERRSPIAARPCSCPDPPARPEFGFVFNFESLIDFEISFAFWSLAA